MSDDINKTNNDYNIQEINSWDDFPELQEMPNLLRGIFSYGFEKPSPIQSKGIKPLMEGRDIIAQAQSGTGKTGCFCIGTLYRIDASINSIQALIMAPTHELAKQIYSVMSNISSLIPNIKMQLLIGGTSINDDRDKLNTNMPHIIIGCPGRIHDIIRRRIISTLSIKIICIDEADEMLSYGFKTQIYNIFQYLPQNVQVGLFSATLPVELYNLTDKFMRNPIKILVKSDTLTLEGISQYYIALNDEIDKYNALKDIYGHISISQCIIYCNSIKNVSDLTEAMNMDEYPVCCIHSGMDKDERNASYVDFKNGKYRVLISSDITSRGIDIQQVSTVINFDVPNCVHTYLHRIGRCGRWGRKGTSINFVTKNDYRKVKDIETHYNIQLRELPNNFNM